MQNNQDHLRFRRRAIPTPGAEQPRNKFGVILTVATAAIILPAMVYGVMHPANISSTVKQIARHLPMQVKDLRVAIVASRTTPTPQPSATPTPASTSTPASPAAKAREAALALHEAHLKHLRELALASAHAKKLASTGQTSDVAGSGPTTPTYTAVNQGSSGATGTSNAATRTTAVAATATPATVAMAQTPEADATPVYAPDVVVDARFTHQVQPEYPEMAKTQGVQGTAVVLATIGPTGSVVSARIDQSTGNKMLDDAALTAAKGSGFQPPIINGKPATETYRLVYSFSL